MRTTAALYFVLLSACNVYDGSQSGPSGGAAGEGFAGAGGASDTTTGPASGGSSDTSGAGVDTASGSGGSTGGGGAGGTSPTDEGSGGAELDASGPGGNRDGGGAVTGAGTGGASGTGGAGGASGAAGASGTRGTAGAAEGGPREAGAPDVAITDAGGVCAPGACKRVFVSANVPAPSGKLGGALAVDTRCQAFADAENLGGSWKAWISDTTTSPAARFTHATVPYRLLNGVTIANDWIGLTSGTLLHTIDVFEDGMPSEAGVVLEVWTGTTVTGLYSGNACANWTNDTANPPNADIGVTSQTGAGWTFVYQQFCNRTTQHVYCFEQ